MVMSLTDRKVKVRGRIARGPQTRSAAPPAKKEAKGSAREYIVVARVVDARSQGPVSGARFQILDERGARLIEGKTDWQGSIREPVPTAGPYRIRVSVDAYEVRAAVVDDKDLPVAKAPFQVLNPAGEAIASGLTDERGEIHARVPSAGAYSVKIGGGVAPAPAPEPAPAPDPAKPPSNIPSAKPAPPPQGGDDRRVDLRRRIMSAYHAARIELDKGAKLHGAGPGKGWCTSGHMRGPLVDAYESAVHMKGDLWCGMFVGYCYKQAGFKFETKARVQIPIITTGGTIFMSGSRAEYYFKSAPGCKFVNFNKGAPWACASQAQVKGQGHKPVCKKFGYKVTRGQVKQWLDTNLVPFDPWPGDVVLFHAGYGGYCRHVGMVGSWDPKTYQMVTFEGDADGSGPSGTRAGAFVHDLSDPKTFLGFDVIGRFAESDFIDGASPAVSPDGPSPDPLVEGLEKRGSGDGS